MRATTPRTNRNVSDRVTPRRLATAAAGRVYADGQPRRYADAYHAYREARERGETVTLAHTRALTERVVRDVLLPGDAYDVQFLGVREPWHVWSLDGDALTRVTSDPRTDALSGTVHDAAGNRVLHPVTLPDLATVYVLTTHDYDADPEGAECHTAEDVDAWKRNEWHYMHVSAFVELVDGRRGEAALGGVELGDYWPGSEAAQIWHTVPDLVREALADAESVPAHTSATDDGGAVWSITTDGGALTGRTRAQVDTVAEFLDALTPPMPYRITRDGE